MQRLFCFDSTGIGLRLPVLSPVLQVDVAGFRLLAPLLCELLFPFECQRVHSRKTLAKNAFDISFHEKTV